MEISEKMKYFFDISQRLNGTNILFADLERILAVFPKEKENIYLGKNIGNLREIRRDVLINNLGNTKIVEEENNSYRSIIIESVKIDGKVMGYIIFFSEDEEFIEEDLEFARKTRDVIEKIAKRKFLIFRGNFHPCL